MFNKNHIYFKQGPETVITIIIINGLYMITYVLKKCKDIAFVGVKTYETITPTTIDNESNNKAIKKKKLK